MKVPTSAMSLDAVPTIAVAGEAIVDIVATGSKEEAVAGGSPCNVAVGLARLGVPARMLARLSTDANGQFLRNSLAANGVDLSHAISAAQPASTAKVSLDAEGVAVYDFQVDGTADFQWRDSELVGAIDATVSALHIGSLAMTIPPGADALLTLGFQARTTATITYDPNCRPLLMRSPDRVIDRIMAGVACADVVKVSTEDLEWLLPGRDHVAIAREWRTLGPALVVVTRGPDGAVAVGHADSVEVPGRKVDVVDTVGAGDSFTSTLLWGLSRRALLGAANRAKLAATAADSLNEILVDAVRASSITCGRRGANPPTLAELEAAR